MKVVIPKSASEEGQDISTIAQLDSVLDDINSTGSEGAEGADDNEDDSDDTGADDANAGDNSGTHENVQNKSNYAFGQMRVQIRQQQQLLSKMADALGIEYKDGNDLLEKLNDDALSRLSEKQNIPKEFLERIEQLEGIASVAREQELRHNAITGFQKVANDYGLDDNALQNFAKELDELGKNPFVEDYDVVELYKAIHFDDIVKKKCEEAVEAALARDNRASRRSTKPGAARTPDSNNDGDAISTVASLNAALNEYK